MLTIVRSPLPTIHWEPVGPPEISDLLKRLEERPQRCQWILPTSRRCRALLRNWLPTRERNASLLPEVHTIRSFVARALEYSARQLPQISGPERLLRVARAWQEVMGRAGGGGLIRQLDRFIRDWQACNLDVPSKPKDIFERVVERYWNDLVSDQRLDPYSSLRIAVEEVSDPESWPNRLFLERIDLLLFDGFHRLEELELELIAALSRRFQVLVWLVGAPGQQSWSVLESAVRRLATRETDTLVIDHVPPATKPFARLARSLFPAQPVRPVRGEALPGLFKLETANSTLEVQAVAKRIKGDYLAAQATNRPLSLREIAVVIPGPEYDALIREIFPRNGLEFNLAGQALRVSSSRPARVLTAALQLVYGHWRHDLLCDFLNLPLVKWRLVEAHRLHELFEHRPRARRQLDHQIWEKTWDHHIQKLRARIDRWKSGELELPEQTLLSRDELVAKQSALADSLERLIQSIKAVLKPVEALAGLVEGATTLVKLIEPCVELLRLLAIDRWLTPRKQPKEHSETQYGVAVPWVEYEKDQNAYYKLLGILKTLPAVPANRLPLTQQGRLDLLGALELALDSETYQIKTEDDAGVQLFELREIRGLRFRHIYVLGLVDGQIPRLPEEGLFGGRRLNTDALARQSQHKEAEVTYLFSQLFEAAEDQLVLAYPGRDPHQKTMPSRFLTAVEEQVALEALEQAVLSTGTREAAIQMGRAARQRDKEARRKEDEETLSAGLRVWLEETAAGLASWQMRESSLGRIRIEAEPLLQMFFPEARVFNPSELETYAACPFRYFGTHVLKLEEREPERTRWDYGSLVHRVFQAFYTEMRRLSGSGDEEPLPAIGHRYRARLIKLFEAEWEQLGEGTLPPDLKKLFACEEGVLHLYFDAIAAIEAEHGNLLNEFVLQDAKGEPVFLGNDPRNRPVLLTGKIDRVDVHRTERTRAIILDYKTGRSKPPKEREAKAKDGRMLQLPLYAAALERARRELRVVGGAYIHLSERLANARKAIAAAGEFLACGVKADRVPFDAESARRLALQLVGEIREGNFSLTAHTSGQAHAECTSYCEMKHACRHPDGYQVAQRY